MKMLLNNNNLIIFIALLTYNWREADQLVISGTAQREGLGSFSPPTFLQK